MAVDRFPAELPVRASRGANRLDIEWSWCRLGSFSKTVVGATPLPRVRIPPPPSDRALMFCCAFTRKEQRAVLRRIGLICATPSVGAVA